MCLFSKQEPELLKEDLEVFKVVKRNKVPWLLRRFISSKKYRALYYRFVYIEGKLYRKKYFLDMCKIATCSYIGIEPNHKIYTGEGYHSYDLAQISMCLYERSDQNVYVKCTIPAGSWIIRGMHGDILSSAIRIDREYKTEKSS